MNEKTAISLEDREDVFKALASSQRLNILSLVLNQDNICAKEISNELELSQPDISYHLSKLTQAGILEKQKEGIKYCYDINYKLLKDIGINPKVLLNKVRR
ncbi:MAG: metalloregulator ArsR/SmtB family transcription factor [Candidatus Bipolaricaulota bacterium]|nr:winged helix-turn-helix transcriptional regulator [Candidatus Bipolaricaulota bacterium]